MSGPTYFFYYSRKTLLTSLDDSNYFAGIRSNYNEYVSVFAIKRLLDDNIYSIHIL